MLAFYRSSVGKKIIMAATGLVLVGFVVAHMAGNTLVFQGADRINGYSHFLHSTGELLWLARVVLLVSVILHVDCALRLTVRARRARPVKYLENDPQVSTLASRTMRFGGLILAIFVVLHILHFTTGTLHPDFHPGDVYVNLVVGLGVWWVAVGYVIAMLALGLHLYHGVWSSVRTLGIARPSRDPLKRRLALVLAIVVASGFAAVPLAIVIGLVR